MTTVCCCIIVRVLTIHKKKNNMKKIQTSVTYKTADYRYEIDIDTNSSILTIYDKNNNLVLSMAPLDKVFTIARDLLDIEVDLHEDEDENEEDCSACNEYTIHKVKGSNGLCPRHQKEEIL